MINNLVKAMHGKTPHGRTYHAVTMISWAIAFSFLSTALLPMVVEWSASTNIIVGAASGVAALLLAKGFAI